ncbi:MAG: putative membrane-anchored protein [Zhongshania sp.]|jgi:uncharacterized membrane-anchored protein
MSSYPVKYWIKIIATTTLRTTIPGYANRSLGIGYAGNSAIAAYKFSS